MQTSGVTTRSCITDLAASNALDALKPGMTVAFCSNDLDRCWRAGAQGLDQGVVDRPDPALELRLRIERLDADATLGAARRADVPSLQGVRDMDRGSREPALSEDPGHGLYVGPVR